MGFLPDGHCSDGDSSWWAFVLMGIFQGFVAPGPLFYNFYPLYYAVSQLKALMYFCNQIVVFTWCLQPIRWSVTSSCTISNFMPFQEARTMMSSGLPLTEQRVSWDSFRRKQTVSFCSVQEKLYGILVVL